MTKAAKRLDKRMWERVAALEAHATDHEGAVDILVELATDVSNRSSLPDSVVAKLPGIRDRLRTLEGPQQAHFEAELKVLLEWEGGGQAAERRTGCLDVRAKVLVARRAEWGVVQEL